MNRIDFGFAIGPMWVRDVVAQLGTSASLGSFPARRITKAAMAWPVVSSVLPTTAASATAGCDDEGRLDLGGGDVWPDTSMMSSTRPRSQK